MQYSFKQGKNFKADFQVSDDVQVVGFRFSGDINEDINFGEALRCITDIAAECKTVSLDVSEILSMNSCGVREWLLFMEELEAKYQIAFSAISEAFVEQANVVCDILGKPGTPIVKIAIPHYCPACDKRQIQQTPMRSLIAEDGTIVMPPINCPTCHAVMEMDGTLKEYSLIVQRSLRK